CGGGSQLSSGTLKWGSTSAHLVGDARYPTPSGRSTRAISRRWVSWSCSDPTCSIVWFETTTSKLSSPNGSSTPSTRWNSYPSWTVRRSSTSTDTTRPDGPTLSASSAEMMPAPVPISSRSAPASGRRRSTSVAIFAALARRDASSRLRFGFQPPSVTIVDLPWARPRKRCRSASRRTLPAPLPGAVRPLRRGRCVGGGRRRPGRDRRPDVVGPAVAAVHAVPGRLGRGLLRRRLAGDVAPAQPGERRAQEEADLGGHPVDRTGGHGGGDLDAHRGGDAAGERLAQP